MIFIATSCSKQESELKLELSAKYEQIQNISSYASCRGPNGSYRTIVKSRADGTCEFFQDLTYQNAFFHAIIDREGSALQLDSLGHVVDTLSDVARMIIQSHQFHKIQVRPLSFIHELRLLDRQGDESVHDGVDQLGNPIRVGYNLALKRILDFEMRNPADTAEKIKVRYHKYKETSFGPLASELTIVQGGTDEFSFVFDSLLVNDQLIPMN